MNVGEIAMPMTMVKAWEFEQDREVDIEIWHDGNYVTTLTISTQNGKVVHQAFASHLEA